MMKMYIREDNFHIIKIEITDISKIMQICEAWLNKNDYNIIQKVLNSYILGRKMIDVYVFEIIMYFKEYGSYIEIKVQFKPDDKKGYDSRDKIIRLIKYIYKELDITLDDSLLKTYYDDKYIQFNRTSNNIFLLLCLSIIVIVSFIVLFNNITLYFIFIFTPLMIISILLYISNKYILFKHK